MFATDKLHTNVGLGMLPTVSIANLLPYHILSEKKGTLYRSTLQADCTTEVVQESNKNVEHKIITSYKSNISVQQTSKKVQNPKIY